MIAHSAQKDGQDINSHLSHTRKPFRPHGDYLKCHCSHGKEGWADSCGATARRPHFINTIFFNPQLLKLDRPAHLQRGNTLPGRQADQFLQ